MARTGEHKTDQARIIAYAEEIGWTYVPCEEADRRRGFDPDGATLEDRAWLASLYFDDLLHAQAELYEAARSGEIVRSVSLADLCYALRGSLTCRIRGNFR